jgi:dynein heavy chain
VILEQFDETLDPALIPLIGKEIFYVKGDAYIKLNDNQVDFNEDFRLYITTNLNNPHFTPEIQRKTCILDFAITIEGLDQQLLSIVCKHESAADEDNKDRLLK